MNPTFILIRHGQTKLNQESRIRAWTDVDIDWSTRSTMEHTGSYLRETLELANPMYTSDLKRAVSTSEIISAETFLEVVQDFRLRPWDVGELSGFKIDKIAPLMEKYIAHPSEIVPGGESWNTFTKRFRGVFEELIRKAIRAAHRGEAVVAVTHSRNIEVARYFVTGDKTLLVTANSVAPGKATSWQVAQGKLVEVPVEDLPTAKEEMTSGTARDETQLAE